MLYLAITPLAWDLSLFSGSWESGGSSAGFFKSSTCTGATTASSAMTGFNVSNHFGAYAEGNILGTFSTAFLRYGRGCNAPAAYSSNFECDGRVMLNFTVGSCTPKVPGPTGHGSCTSPGAFAVTMLVSALPTSQRPPKSIAFSSSGVCGGMMANSSMFPGYPGFDSEDTSCCPPDYCAGPQRTDLVPTAWSSTCDFAPEAPTAATLEVEVYSNKSYSVDVTALLQAVGPGNGSFPCDPTLKLFPTTDFVTDSIDITVSLSGVGVSCAKGHHR